MNEEREKLAVFIDFDNIQIGVKDTLGKEFDVSLVLEALKDRGEVVTKVAYGDWHRAGDQSRQMTQHAVQMVQRNVTPRGDKNGADINLALDALEMAFTRHHISAFAIVGGDSDFIALVEKLKQYDKRVLIVGGRAFTSGILQRNCHEFISYENLLKGDSREARIRMPRGGGRAAAETRALAAAQPNLERALKILAEREVAPQIGLLKSTLLQLDPTFSERDFGAGSFLEFLQKMQRAGLVRLERTDRGFLVETKTVDGESAARPASEGDGEGTGGTVTVSEAAAPGSEPPETAPVAEAPAETAAPDRNAGLEKLRSALARNIKGPSRPLYLRHVVKALRAEDREFKEQSYGFRSLLDLLHFAERGGVVRLERDRRGVLRIFPTGAAAAKTLPPEVPALEPEVPVAETEVRAVQETVIEEAAVEPLPLPETPPEAELPEAESKAKPRKARGRRSGSGTHRRSGARRPSKATSPTGEDTATNA